MNALVLKLTIFCGLAVLLLTPLRGDEALNPVPAQQAQVRENLNTIFVSIDLKNASIKQAVEALAVSSRKSDPAQRGIAFYLDPRTADFAKPITLKLDHVPVGVALRYVCELSYINSAIDNRCVDILPPRFGCEGLSEETFHVDPSFMQNTQHAIPPSALSPP